MNSSTTKPNRPTPIDAVFPIDRLIQTTLERLEVTSLEELAALDIHVVSKHKGIGSKKQELLAALILKARVAVNDASAGRDKRVGEPSKTGAAADIADSELLFVPSLLKPIFERAGCGTVSDLAGLQPQELESRGNWGVRKIGLLVALQGLYRHLATCESSIDNLLVESIVDSQLLPDPALGDMTVRQFVDASGDELQLRGRQRIDFEGLKRLLINPPTGSIRTEAPAYLAGFEHPQMDWRDVPLTVPKRVADFLDRFQLVTLLQLDQLASTGHFICPQSGKPLVALDQGQFGDTSLKHLRSALKKLAALGLDGYRRGVMCGLEQLPSPETNWRDMPLRISKRVSKFLDTFRLKTLKDLHTLAVRMQVRCPKTGNVLSAVGEKNFSALSLAELRKELLLLAGLGLDTYRYGESGKPGTAAELAVQVSKALQARAAEVFRLRCTGLTLEEAGERFGITRERIRQIEKRVVATSGRFRAAAEDILKPVDQALLSDCVVALNACVELSGAEQDWQFSMTAMIAGRNYALLDSESVSRFSSRQIEALDALVRDAIRNRKFVLDDGRVSLQQLVTSASDQQKWFVKEWAELVGAREESLTKRQLMSLIGTDWLRTHVRAQLVEAGANGLFFDQVDTSGVIATQAELVHVLGNDADVVADGRFRRPSDVYSKADEIVAIVRQAETPISATEIMQKSQRSWYQPVLVGRYLTVLHEIVTTDRGQYIHIDKLSLTVRDVVRIEAWGAELLAGENKLIDGEELFDLFRHADLGLSLENAYQLVSIVAKHPDVRRISNNLQLAHRDSFDDSELFLAVTDPDLCAQWHPDKNGAETPETVRPTSAKVYWWRCDLGHEFEASPVYRTRMIRTCPGCQERWTIAKIRHFVRALQKHLDAFTPAELYVIFQQSGLSQQHGKAKGFVKALATGRFPRKELDKFVDGEDSLVDDFLDDSDLELDQPAAADNEQLGETDAEPADDVEPQRVDESELPQVRAKKALEALDNSVIASLDSEAAEFLLASAKAKIWSHAYENENEAVAEAEKYGKSAYAEEVRAEFFREYRAAQELEIPDGYSFSIDGDIRHPNLMQRHVATQIRDRLRYGNWSGTGAGKTLSAILATRVVDASLTVVCCPNAVVGDVSDGWASEIRRVYPESEVVTKTLNPSWSGSGKHRYLVLNYEQLQQPNSEALLKQFVGANNVDSVVIDEVHHAKQRYADQMSQRKRLLQALVSVAGDTNPDLHVLGMSATPVVNNLQEGRSLVEMITGVEHDDIDVKPTVANCMRLHQKLATLGTRWRPTYASVLETETVDIDCSEFLPEIRAVGRNHSPLDLEKILTRARLPVILQHLARGVQTLVYTYYVDEIDRILYDAISAAGYRTGFYTGDLKGGLNAFKAGKLDVLIGSSAVGTGVDGLQFCCNQLIINVLPWTNAEYEQLIGRLWRQGQIEDKVKIVVPVTFADVNGQRWSYCDSKLHRIHYKKSIADAAVDGAVPEGNLRSPAQAQRDVMAWLERLEQGDQATITRRRIVVPLSGDLQQTRRRLGQYGDFSQMNNRWNQSNSPTLRERLRANPEEWEQYHTLYRQARANWPVVPVDEMIAWCQRREGYEIGDFGCGEALLAKAVGDRHAVYSFDHVAIDESVMEGDMAHTPLDDKTLDVAVFSLSLMGKNFTDYLREAYRVLKMDGHLHIWEATSRFSDVQAFCAGLEALGFRAFPPEDRGQFTHIQAQKTDREPDQECELNL